MRWRNEMGNRTVGSNAFVGMHAYIPTSDLLSRGWLAGCAGSAQPLDSATCIRLHMGRWTCMSSSLWGAPALAGRSPTPSASSVCLLAYRISSADVCGCTAVDSDCDSLCPFTRRGKFAFDPEDQGTVRMIRLGLLLAHVGKRGRLRPGLGDRRGRHGSQTAY